ncbi:hypothetical protein EV192_108341 [Actinocrispum wychmicini]|uniref:Uncharacterized protein n=1 Tax=Actinocrispum wychmicini TaxID=1213861 RepID=A0A4R2J7G8_9PSEU|nr:hypothetical protein EV192_108341 [Actinocrispum wychmicini]
MIIVLSVVGVSAIGVLAGAVLLHVGKTSCPDVEEAMAQELADSTVLRLVPPNSSSVYRYVTKPCKDDDNIGQVGIGFGFSGADSAFLDYYKTELPPLGWTLRGELPAEVPGEGLALGRPQLCFENTGKPGVILNVDLPIPAMGDLPASPYFLEYRFTSEGLSCSDVQRP